MRAMMRLAQHSLTRVLLNNPPPPPPPPPPNLLVFYPESILKVLYADSDWYNLWGGTKVYIFGKVSLLGVQKFQNQGHMSYKRKAFVAEA